MGRGLYLVSTPHTDFKRKLIKMGSIKAGDLNDWFLEGECIVGQTHRVDIKLEGLLLPLWNEQALSQLVANFGRLEKVARQSQNWSGLGLCEATIKCSSLSDIPHAVQIVFEGRLFRVNVNVAGRNGKNGIKAMPPVSQEGSHYSAEVDVVGQERE